MAAPVTGDGEVGGTPRTRVRRLPDRAVHDRAVLHAVLDAGRVAHVAISDGDQPYALPVAYARDGDRVLLPGRWAQIRPPSAKELAATLVLALPLTECSVKVGAGPPDDAAEDLDRPVWAGVIPLVESYGPPQPAPDLRHALPAPEW